MADAIVLPVLRLLIASTNLLFKLLSIYQIGY